MLCILFFKFIASIHLSINLSIKLVYIFSIICIIFYLFPIGFRVFLSECQWFHTSPDLQLCLCLSALIRQFYPFSQNSHVISASISAVKDWPHSTDTSLQYRHIFHHLNSNKAQIPLRFSFLISCYYFQFKKSYFLIFLGILIMCDLWFYFKIIHYLILYFHFILFIIHVLIFNFFKFYI